MHIIEITLEGFKSYSSRTVIEKFDPQFNAITGLNGSGKSNILDAICFVMGISQLSHVRAEKLQELVYKQGNSGVTKASVTIVFDNKNKNQSPPGYTETDQISITRTIENQKSKYYINGKTETADKVKSLFCSVKLNVNNPHFLIMQGRVTKVINMKPKEILGLIEEAAGISLYENKKLQTKALIEKKDNKLKEIETILKDDVEPQLESLRKEKDDYTLFKSNENTIEESEKILIAFEFWENDKHVSTYDQKVKEIKNKIKSLEKEVNQKELEIEQIKVQIQQKQKGIGNNDQETKLKEDINKLENEMLDLQLQINRVTKESEQFEKIKKNNMGKAEVMRQEIDKDQKKIEEIENEFIYQAEKDYDNKKEQIRDIEKEIRLIKEGKDNSIDQQQSIIKAIQDQETNLNNNRNKKNAIQSEIKITTQKIKEHENDLKNKESEKKNFEQERQQLVRQTEGLKKEIETKEYNIQEFPKIREDKIKVERQLEEIEREGQSFGNLVNFINFDYKMPYQTFDKKLVLGKLMNLFKIKDPKKYGDAIEAAAGGKLLNVVVRNERVSKELIQNQCLRYGVTFIPLSAIQSMRIPQDTIKKIKELTQGKAKLAIELIEYDPELESAMQFAFGSVWVSEDEAEAKRIAYNDFAKFMCVTVKGDKYNPQGTLEGGFNQKAGLLNQVSKFKDHQERRNALLNSFEKLKDKYNQQAQTHQNVEQMKQKLQLLEHQLRVLDQRINDQSDPTTGQISGSERLRVMKEDLQELNFKLQKTNEKEDEIKKEIENLKKEQKQLTEVGGNQKEKYYQDKLKQAQKEKDALQKLIQSLREKKNQLEIKNDERKTEIINIEEKMRSEEDNLKQELWQLGKYEQDIKAKKTKADSFRDQLDKIQMEKTKANHELDNLCSNQRRKEVVLGDLETELKDYTDQVRKMENSLQNSASVRQKILEKNKWIENEKDFFGVQGHKYDFNKNKNTIAQAREDNKRCKEENEQLKKRINLKVDAMFEKTENQYNELNKKRETTKSTKGQLEAAIFELDELKNKEIEKTWKKVDQYCSEIYSTLLQGASARLAPPEGKTVQDGLELKVGFSGQWKDSLSELSGGQRSLLALSLILALLKHHPAPLYILDEIDSALDLSHTQNIGLMIRKFFQNSQFVIVSLKEGLFSNANVLFKVQFLDNRSQVKRFQVRKNENQINDGNQRQKSRGVVKANVNNNNDDEDMEYIDT